MKAHPWTNEYFPKRLPLHLYVAKLRMEARLDRLEIEGMWTVWSHAEEGKARDILRRIKILQVKAAEKEAQADRWERELVRRAEAAAGERSPQKPNDINGLGPTVRK